MNGRRQHNRHLRLHLSQVVPRESGEDQGLKSLPEWATGFTTVCHPHHGLIILPEDRRDPSSLLHTVYGDWHFEHFADADERRADISLSFLWGLYGRRGEGVTILATHVVDNRRVPVTVPEDQLGPFVQEFESYWCADAYATMNGYRNLTPRFERYAIAA